MFVEFFQAGIRLGKVFKLMVFRLLEDAFLSQNIVSSHFLIMPLPDSKLSRRFLSSPHRQRDITDFPQAAFFTSRKKEEEIITSFIKIQSEVYKDGF